MRELTQDEIDLVNDVFEYHAPTPEDVEAYKQIRAAAKVFAFTIVRTCPRSADRSVALRKVREAVMTANASIALRGAGLEVLP